MRLERKRWAKGSTLVRGVAFAPCDEPIAAFLANRQAPALSRPDWLEPAAAPAVQMPTPGQADAANNDQAAQIRTLHAAGKSLNAIQDEVFGYRGGAEDS